MFKVTPLDSLYQTVQQQLRSLCAYNVLLIFGNKSSAVFLSTVQESSLKNFSIFRIGGFNLYPKIGDLLSVSEIIKSNKIDTIIGIGGGTVLDIAKSAAVLHALSAYEIINHFDENIEHYSGKKLKLILLPTNCGTGAEITPFTVIYHDNIKHSFYGKCLLPSFCIHCPELTATLSLQQMAIGVFDALSQSIESLWSRRACSKSSRFASEALGLLLANLSPEANSPREHAASFMKAAYLSGRAIALTTTTGPHALSYHLTAKFEIPHGLAVMITLPAFFLFHERLVKQGRCDAATIQKFEHIYALLNVKSGDEAYQRLKLIAESFQVDISLSAYLNKDELTDLQHLTYNAERLQNHPVFLSKDDTNEILFNSFFYKY